jgi:putative flippase GtrA
MRILRFLAVGCVGLLVDSSLFSALYHGGLRAPFARAASIGGATLVAWYLNRRVTFEPSGRAPLAEMARYAGVATVAQGFNYAVFIALLRLTNEAAPLACLFASSGMAAGLSFTGQALFAFARKAPAQPIRADARLSLADGSG